jgi:hypothetical protein
MIKYMKIPYSNAAGDSGFRYKKDNLMTKEARIPHEVMEKFEYASEVEYDDVPDKRRCIFCDAPQSRQRYLDGGMLDLCEYHYQNKSLGTIAAQMRLLKEEQEKQDGLNAKSQAKGKRKLKRSPRKDSIALNYTRQ